MSHLAWIDFDRDAQRAAREMMAQLNAPEARDELGLGTIRDGLADLLFPGTSTIPDARALHAVHPLDMGIGGS